MKKKRLHSGIPRDILSKIISLDEGRFMHRVRYYSYLEWQGRTELAIATVAVKFGKTFKNKSLRKRYIKKVCIHVVGDPDCYYRDIHYTFMAGYIPEFYEEEFYDKKDCRKQKLLNVYGDSSWWGCAAKYFRLYNYGNIINPEFLKLTDRFQYCAWDGKVDLLDYLEAYEKNPKIEFISKLVGSKFAMSKQLVAKATKDKQFLFWLRDHKEEALPEKVSIVLNAYNKGMTIKEARRSDTLKYYFSKKSNGGLMNSGIFREIYQEKSEEIKEKMREYIHRNNTTPEHYADYIKALHFLSIDLNDTKNLFPQDWTYWSGVRINQYATLKAEKDAEKYRALTKKLKSIAEKYSFLTLQTGTDFVVFIADSKESLLREGEYLHHCVGRMDYDQRMIKEESLVFFVREASQPQIPFVTVEYSIKNKKVLQCYTDHDQRPSQEVLDFVNHWEEKSKRKMQKFEGRAA